jgi:hypothetical protein
MITRRGQDVSRLVQAGDAVLHPVALLALGVLVLNDHALKAAYPGLVTGKLSDVAGVVLLPLVLVAGWELVCAALGRGSGPRTSVLALAILLTGVGFTLVKVSPPVALAFGSLLGAVQWPVAVLAGLAGGHPVALAPSAAPIVVDPGDLLALPALAIATWVGAARVRCASGLGPDAS